VSAAPQGWTRTPAFWIAYAALSTVALAIAWNIFPLAIPLVNLDITLSRAEARTRAEVEAAKQKIAPQEAKSAVRFAHDSDTQNYVELEGGGKAAFGALVQGELYAPYWWEVRIFKPGEVSEATIRFRPDGSPNGFTRRVPETYVRDEASKALSADSARALAEERGKSDWGMDLKPYTLLEQSQQVRATGRVDHAFVYQRPEMLGEARFRMRLSVAGDELIEIAPYVHVPESFDRRFRELRSTNDTIAGIAGIAAGLLYGLGGCILGVLWLARSHWLVPRPALVAGLVVGGLMAAASLSAAPAAWFEFDTAQSTTTFWSRQVGLAVAIVLGGGLAYGLVFMAAESLTRRAFPWQPQLWRVWSRDAASTHAVLGRTLGGYLFVPIELALVALFYLATNRWLGWWQPSEVLTDPNILSAAVPALMPIAISLQAGFMEECLFRAVPLALGALIGAHFGRRGLGIAVALVLQALVFGAAHANYPGFPAYSRLVELVVPSMMWAAIFLRFGLLSTILLHALYDLSLFAIPLFLVEAPGASAQRALVFAAGLVPLAVIAWRRVRAGEWAELPQSVRNAAWQPGAPPPARVRAQRSIMTSRIQTLVQRALPLLGLVGFAGWLFFTPSRADVPQLVVDRAGAERAADAALEARGVKLAPEWRRFATIRKATDDGQWTQHRFVWREAGPEAYRALIGSTLSPPLWEVRYAMFEGDVAGRAEEWRVTINPDGSLRQVRHQLPEGRDGARLSREQALARAEDHLRARFGLDPAALTQVAAEDRDRPARTDWSFVFADPRVDVGKDGEARIALALAGDEVVGSRRYVHVPETSLRSERERTGRNTIGKIAGGLLYALAGIAALVAAVRSWLGGESDNRALALVFAIGLATSVASIAVMWPSLAMQLKTTEPVVWQVVLATLGSLLAAAVGALLIALIGGVGTWAARTSHAVPLAGHLPPWAAGACAALFVAGAGALAGSAVAPETPQWPSLAFESTAVPWAAAGLAGLATVGSIAVGLFLLYLLDRVTASWTRRGWLAAFVVFAVIAGLVAVKAGDAGAALAEGIASGLVAAAVIYFVLRFDPRTVPGYVVAASLIDAAENAALTGTPSAWTSFAVMAAVSVAVGYAATRYLGRPLPSTSTR